MRQAIPPEEGQSRRGACCRGIIAAAKSTMEMVSLQEAEKAEASKGENSMKQKEQIRKSCAAAIAAAAVIMAVPQLVRADETPAGPSTDVWIDVVKPPTQDRISVTVSMAYGFAVVGSQDTMDTTSISLDNNTLLLPNVYVEVKTDPEGGPDGNYSLDFQGSHELPVNARHHR